MRRRGLQEILPRAYQEGGVSAAAARPPGVGFESGGQLSTRERFEGGRLQVAIVRQQVALSAKDIGRGRDGVTADEVGRALAKAPLASDERNQGGDEDLCPVWSMVQSPAERGAHTLGLSHMLSLWLRITL